MALCLGEQEYKNDPYPILHKWELLNLKSSTLRISITKMIKTFHGLLKESLKELDVVLIESQEKAVAKMKKMQAAVQSFFETMKIENGYKYKVEFASGGGKLQVYTGPIDWKVPKTKSDYTLRKKTAVEHCKRLLDPNTTWYIDFDTAYKNKEHLPDKSDAYLQMCFYFKQNLKERLRQPEGRHKIQTVITKYSKTVISGTVKSPKKRIKIDVYVMF